MTKISQPCEKKITVDGKITSNNGAALAQQ